MRGHIRKRGSTWSFVIDIGRDDSGIRKQQWRSGFRTRKEAETALTKTLHALSEGTYIEPTNLTVGVFLNDHWVPAVRSTIRPTTFGSYGMHVRKYLVPLLGRLSLQRLTAASVNAMYSELLASGLSAASVQRVHATLHRALQDAVRWQLTLKNVSDQANPPRPSRPEMKVWTAAEVNQFLTHIDGDRLRTLFLLIVTIGLRRGEALGLRWRDIDFKAARLSVNRALVPVDHRLQFAEPKTDKGRRALALPPVAVAALREHRKHQLKGRLVAGPAYKDDDLVFAEADGRPHHPEMASRRFSALVRSAELPLIRLHDLRHTYATLALEAGVNPKVVSENLGHSTVAMTLDVYTHVSGGAQEEAAGKVAALIFGS